MLNWANVGVFFDKSKSQLESLSNQFRERSDSDAFIIKKKRSRIFSNKALSEILEQENLQVKRTQIITMANQKGGVGKTSTVLSQGRNLSDLGFKVLIIDTDAQANTTKSLIKRPVKHSLLEVLNGDIKILNSILKIKDNLDLLPANADCSRIDLLLNDPQFTYNPATLIKGLINKNEYNFVLIDTNPSFSAINIACIASSDRVICPVPLGEWEIDGVKQVSKVIDGINSRLNTNISLDFLITKFQINETTAFEGISKIKKVKGNLLNTLIPLASEFKKAQATGMLEIKGKAYKETLRLTREIVQNSVGQ